MRSSLGLDNALEVKTAFSKFVRYSVVGMDKTYLEDKRVLQNR